MEPIRFPCLEIDLKKIRHNVRQVSAICRRAGIEPVAILKGTNGSAEIAQAIAKSGISAIGDSRIRNLIAYQDIPVKKMLVRLPMLSEIQRVIQYADISLNSELIVIRALAEQARKQNKQHDIILMIEVGDLREGIYDKDELFRIIREVKDLQGVRLKGLGTNLNCFGSIKPSKENLGQLVQLQQEIKRRFGLSLEVISGGSTGSIALIQKNEMPAGINQLRIGTAFLNGFVEASLPRIPNTFMDAFRLKAEIIEIKWKPSKPYGERGVDAFRNKIEFEDIGIRRRAICAIGKQDTEPRFMYPADEGIEIIGSSSDHVVVDITNEEEYRIGDKLEFILDYAAILRTMTSEHVKKIYIGEH